MERGELRHDRHTVSILTDRTVISPRYRVFCELHSQENKREERKRTVRRRFHTSMNGASIGRWAPSCFHGWKVAREIYTESGDAECKNAGVQALYLSPVFSDFGRLT